MSDWNAWKEKATNLAKAGADKAKELSEIARLNLEIRSEEEKIKQSYLEIGKRYHLLHQAAPEEGYAPMFSQITESEDNIMLSRQRIAWLREQGNTEEK